MATVLDSIVFDPKTFEKELNAFEILLKSKAGVLEVDEIQDSNGGKAIHGANSG